jgi:uncharacterized membrane protein YozB (DUF420 family)
MMKHMGAIVSFLMAVFAIYLGATAEEFYPGQLGRKTNRKPIPRWFGRLWCFVFAAVAIYMGIRYG